MNNLNGDQQTRMSSWLQQKFPGYTLDFQNNTISGPQPLDQPQIEQINNYVNTLGVTGVVFAYGTHGERQQAAAHAGS